MTGFDVEYRKSYPCPSGTYEVSDPVAQSFSVPEGDGIFVTKCDIFFSEKDAVMPVWFEIRNMENGYPGVVVVPYTHTVIQAENINVSDDATLPTTFNFQAPAYLMPGTDYCIGYSGLEFPSLRLSRCLSPTMDKPRTIKRPVHYFSRPFPLFLPILVLFLVLPGPFLCGDFHNSSHHRT